MSTKPKKRNVKRKLKIKTGARIAKKDSVKNDTLPRMQAQPPRTTGTVFKVKIKKKND